MAAWDDRKTWRARKATQELLGQTAPPPAPPAETEAEIDAYNARQLRIEISTHLTDAQHSIDLALGCLEDLAVYLPKA